MVLFMLDLDATANYVLCPQIVIVIVNVNPTQTSKIKFVWGYFLNEEVV